jgi:hypothetical protein
MGRHRKHTAPRTPGQLAFDQRRAAAKAARIAGEAERKRRDLEARAEAVIRQARQFGGIWYHENGDHRAIAVAVESGKLVRVQKQDRVLLVVNEPLV